MYFRVLQSVALLSISVLLSSCATPVYTLKIIGSGPVPNDIAIDCIVQAGATLGLKPTIINGVDKANGRVQLVTGGAGMVTAVMFAPVLAGTNYAYSLKLIKDGQVASGVDVKIAKIGGFTDKREEAANLLQEAVLKCWKAP